MTDEATIYGQASGGGSGKYTIAGRPMAPAPIATSMAAPKRSGWALIRAFQVACRSTPKSTAATMKLDRGNSRRDILLSIRGRGGIVSPPIRVTGGMGSGSAACGFAPGGGLPKCRYVSPRTLGHVA